MTQAELRIVTEQRKGDWYWRFEQGRGYSGWNGPYCSEAAAVRAGALLKRRRRFKEAAKL